MSSDLTYQDVEIIQRALSFMLQSYKNLRELPLQDVLAVNGFLQVGIDELPEGLTEEMFREMAELFIEDFQTVSDKLKENYGV